MSDERKDWGGGQQGQQWAPPPAAETTQSTVEVLEDWYMSEEGERELHGMLPSNMPTHLSRHVVTAWASAVASNPELMTCTPASLKQTLQDCARVGLWPGPAGHIFLIPYKGVATAQIGWKGVVAMLKRDTAVIRVDSGAIHEFDQYEARRGTTPVLEISPALTSDRGKIVAWYAVAHFGDGGPPQFELMTQEEMVAHRDQYGARKRDGSFKAWATAFEEMARKTVIKRLAKHVGAGDVLAWAMRDLDPTTRLPEDPIPARVAGWDVNDTTAAIRGRMGLEDRRQR